MATLPWTTTATMPDADVLVLGSRLELRRARDIPGFLRAAMRIRTQVLASDGAYGVSLIAQPLRRTFWTLSAWRDDAALHGFVRTAPHVDVMRKYHDRMKDAAFTTWTEPASDLPHARSNSRNLWQRARGRLAAAAGTG